MLLPMMLAAPLLSLAGAAAAVPAPQAPETKAGPPAAEPRRCTAPGPDETRIIICAERPQGYRLDPDIMEAKRLGRAGRGASGARPNGAGPRPDCATVGPVPCRTGGINLLSAVPTAIAMAKRAAAGKDVGSLFVTDPQLSEYQRYKIAKARREAAEEAKKAAQVQARAQAQSGAQAEVPAAPAAANAADPLTSR